MSESSPNIRRAYHPDLVILVVEDYMLFSKEMKHALPGHKLVFARSIEEGKLRYSECLPHIIFLDLDLPDGNGFELLDHIRTCEPEAYVIILTGSKLPDDRAAASLKGAKGYIIKPFIRSKIEHCIEEYLAYREKIITSQLAQTEKHRHKTNLYTPSNPNRTNTSEDNE
jgi:DNA-binding NtrC family response regulator